VRGRDLDFCGDVRDSHPSKGAKGGAASVVVVQTFKAERPGQPPDRVDRLKSYADYYFNFMNGKIKYGLPVAFPFYGPNSNSLAHWLGNQAGFYTPHLTLLLRG
jgi:hypothetical protein